MVSGVSLIVTTYNQKERLQVVLDSLLQQSFMPNEILIADDGSTEDTQKLVAEYQIRYQEKVKIKHVWHEDDGFRLAEIRNKAILEAEQEYIIIIDGDMILQKDFVSDHVRFAKEGVFLQGGRILLDSLETKKILDHKIHFFAFEKFHFKAMRIALLSYLAYQKSFDQTILYTKKLLPVRGCNMSFYKKDAEKINGFNESFIGWGREDSEFVARFLFAGGVMKRLKFAGIAYHLYHIENARAMLKENHQIYLNTLENKLKQCKNGLKKL